MTFSRRAVVSYWRKYVHEVLVNRLGGLSLPRKSVVRLTDRPDMTLDVYRGRKTTMQHVDQWLYNKTEFMININKQKAIFGIEQIKPPIRPINYILIVSRYYIYKCRISNKNLNLNAWKSTVKQFLEIEKLKAIKNNKYDVFLKHWDIWCISFDV